ncbi:MAG: high frequency lysogenization protein HflD [Gammaproteobacteria bacterium]|nr:high frequency lysogenization protein HflD [Gammaproteobacteria bacterium]
MNIHNRTLALAGLFQSVRLVQQTARGEPRDEETTAASIGSIFNTDPATAVDVYGDIEAIRTGLEVLVQQLGNDNKRRDMELTRYVITLMHLERKLGRKPKLLNIIRSGVETCKQQIESDDEHQASVIATLADIYKQTISTLQPRILVSGEPGILTNTDSKNMVRALLLAGIRSAVLLRQSGGTRLKLIFQRRQLFDCARELLQEMACSGHT